MSVVITLEDIRAYAEVDYIINHMNIKYKEKVPEKMLTFFSTYKDPNHEINIDPYVPLQNQGLSRYCLEIIALLHLKYWCENEERKQELYDIMLRNQEKLDAQMKEKFSVDNLFSTEKEEEPKEDFSRPRVIQKFEQYTEQNEDIKDYTDLQEEQPAKENLPVDNNVAETVGFFQTIKNFFASIFGKKN